jgi:ankyrin repeat protein
MRRICLAFFLGLFASAIFGQPTAPLDEHLADLMVKNFPEWKPDLQTGSVFSNWYPDQTSKSMSGRWSFGDRHLSVSVALGDDSATPFERRWFFFRLRSVVPRTEPLAEFGKDGVLVQRCSAAEMAFTRENIFVHVVYHFPRACADGSLEAVPMKELERTTLIARALYNAIDRPRSMEPCKNDFLTPGLPRPISSADKLLFAAFNGNTALVRSLIKSGVSMGVRDAQGNSPLHLAVTSGCIQTVSALITSKADVNAPNERGATPLMLAANLKEIEALRLLIRDGADVKAKDKYGQNAGFYAIRRPEPRLFPRVSNREVIIDLLRTLRENGTDLNAQNHLYGDTLLTIHLGEGDRLQQWADLIDLGVNVNGSNHAGETLLIKTVRPLPDEAHLQAVKFLLSRGADPDHRDREGRSARDYLVEQRKTRLNSPEWTRNIDEMLNLLANARRVPRPAT